ncbi:MAG TPA: TonB-dependent receptor [Bryobacteraceae bacterium]|nr:TonB-dependent receptor [Bryobacteraceae bacterium]
MILILLVLAAAFPVWGQIASGSVLGEIRDESGAVVPGARVTARHEATGFARSVFTGPEGVYQIEQLLPGPCTVTAEKFGFQTVIAGPIVLEVNQRARLDLVLKVGIERESVTVTTAVSPLRADDPSAGHRLDAASISSLPLDQRNVISLASLGPGVIPRALGGFVHDIITDVQPGRGAVALNPSVNGARSPANAFLLDGAADTDRLAFVISVVPPMESVQEFRMQTSLPSAEFAQTAGGVVDVVTKAGAREWHGNAFEYFRNEALDARNFFDDPSLPRPIFRQNQFGGSLGGPVPLPSTFFFAAYEGLRGKSAKSSLNLVPDTTVRGGDFRGRNPIFDPLDRDPVTGARQPFPGNVVPLERIDPVARRFLDTYQPLPNRSGSSGNYLDATPNENTDDNVSARIDHELHGGSRVFGRYTLNEQRGRFAGSFPVRPTEERIRAQQAALGLTFGRSSWLNEARVSFTRLRVFDVPESAFKTNVAKELGISGIPDDPFTYGLPYFLITNFSTVTDSPTLPLTQRDNLWHFSDEVSVARGRHTLRFGFEWVRFNLNYLQSQLARGQFIFTGALTGDPSAPGTTGDPLADFLLGFPQITSRNVGTTLAYLHNNSAAGYVQSDWRWTSRLTLNFGLRYEYTSPFTEGRDHLQNLDYSTLPAAPRLVPVKYAVDPDRNNFAPRVGLAFRPLPGRELVFRAGYGIYFSQEMAIESYDLIRNGVRNENNVTDGITPVLTLENGFPQTASTGLPGYFGIDRHARTPYVQQWSAGLQKQLPEGIVLDVSYVGTKGTRLGRFRRFNTPLRVETGENLPPRPGDLQQLRPFPELGEIIQRQHISNSIYHSLQVKVEKRMASRLTFLSSFVWSKSIDDADSVIPGFFESFGAQDERNLRLERGLSFFDVGRRISAGFVYALPASAFLRPVLSGWGMSGIVTLQDGTPLNPVYFAFDPANSGTPNRPDVVPGVSVRLPRSQRTADHFFNTDAFRAPAPYTFGNAGRNILPGPGNNVFDLALHRQFPVRESKAVEFRAEFFNAFNHPNFGIPGPYPDFGPFFGKIFATGQPRRVQLALRIDF